MTAEAYRLSPQQRRLWTIQRPDEPLVSQCVVALNGDLDRERLQRSLERSLDRHQSLRTAFRKAPGRSLPLQAIGERGETEWRTEELSDLDAESLRARQEEILAEERSELPVMEPVVRVRLMRLAAERHLLAITVPVLRADAESLRDLVQEMARSYAGAETASEEPIQYLQFSEWQHGLLEDDDAPKGRDYWRDLGLEELAGRSLLPFVPASGEGEATVRRALGGDTAKRLERCAEEIGVTLSDLLTAGWLAVLSRLSGATELVVGDVRGGSGYDILEDALGLFSRTVPLVARLQPDYGIDEVARRVAAAREAGEEWLEYFDAGELGQAPEAAFEVGFQLLEGLAPFEADGLRWSFEHLADRGAEGFRLLLVCIRRGAALDLELAFDEDDVERSDAERTLEHLATLLNDVAERPRAPVGTLRLLAEDEPEVLTAETAGAEPAPGGIHELVERRAEEVPDSVAVVFGEERLSFGELVVRARRLAARLTERRVGPEVPVGLCFERGPEMVEALLGVLFAGGAYVPLDPGQPDRRLAGMAEDAGVELVIHAGDGRGDREIPGVEWMALDRRREGEERSVPVPPQSTAYVIFTSGSTGRPKGVMVEHRHIGAYAAGILERLPLPERASFATVSPLSADLGYTAVFPALVSGGVLHVLAEETFTDARALSRYFARHPVDCFKVVPSHLRALGASASLAELVPDRVLVLGGEAASREWLEELTGAAPGLEVYNHYGPTETTVGVLCGSIHGECPGETPPLGRPIGRALLAPLDRTLQPAPTWAPAELCVGGPTVTRGYAGRPAETAERFVPNPWGEDSGDRLYRTGDLVRRLPGGGLQFLGRLDDQVKIRGFRIEPEEVAATLRRHDGVRDAHALVTRDGGDGRLCAYYVPAPAKAPEQDELRDLLAERLPGYMVPSALAAVDELPRLPHGKIDRAALPEPEEAAAVSQTEYVAPEGPVQEYLTSLWAEVLGVDRDRVGVRQNFFELGGHSLLAMQVISRVREVFRTEFPVRSMFGDPTIENLASVLYEAHDDRAAAEKVARVAIRVERMEDDEVAERLKALGAEANPGEE